jgi:hypothetical protein
VRLTRPLGVKTFGVGSVKLLTLLSLSAVWPNGKVLPAKERAVSYRNKTYVVFDGDSDMWAYAFMKGWKSNENVDFNFHDAHSIGSLTANAQNEQYVKSALRERFASAKQVVCLIGESTKNLYRYVRWELDVALNLDLPIIAVYLNGSKQIDSSVCPAIIRETYTVHIPFKAGIIQYALDNFPDEYAKRDKSQSGPRLYPASVYERLGI